MAARNLVGEAVATGETGHESLRSFWAGVLGRGIRSPTFGLGVLEGLKSLGLLEQVHYLSTVSGGGYIGGWFSANCRRAKDRADTSDWRSSEADWASSYSPTW